MKIYVASSWRNKLQPDVVARLRMAGHEVYDFRHPGPAKVGFAWSQIDPDWQQWTPAAFASALEHPIAVGGFDNDMNALRDSDAVVLVLPCGRSAHLELGWAVGAGKQTIVLQLEPCEPELMYRMCHYLATSWEDFFDYVGAVQAVLDDELADGEGIDR
jgi:hypothetical protein